MSPSPIVVNIRREPEGNGQLNDFVVIQNRDRIMLRLQKFLSPLIFLGYSLVLVFHFIGWVLFSVYAVYCSFTQHSTTQRCQNFDLFNHPKELEVCWQVITGINAITYMMLIRKQHYADASSFSMRELSKIPRSSCLLLVELAIAASYETMMVVHEKVASARAIELGFIWRNICVTSLVFFLNFTSPPREMKYRVHFFSTLMVFFLDQLVLASLMACHVHFRITALEANHSNINAGDFFHGIVTMMTICGVLTLHSSLLKFFWNKICDSNKNLLRKGHI